MSNLKYDYKPAFKLTEKVPQLSSVFQTLGTTRTSRNLLANKFVYLFFFFNGAALTATFMNMKILGEAEDFSNDFRIMPDYLTKTRSVSFRKEQKRFYI